MKKSDIFTIILVASIGIIVSAVLLNMLLGDPNDKSVSFKTVDVVEAALAEPDPEVFNPDAINPTVEVYVGDCIDVDQDGELSEAELVACGRAEINIRAGGSGETSSGGSSGGSSSSGGSAAGDSQFVVTTQTGDGDDYDSDDGGEVGDGDSGEDLPEVPEV